MARLGFDLKRRNEIPTNQSDLVGRWRMGFRKRKVVVALVSSPTDWTNYEMGFARGYGNPILALYREFGGEQGRATILRFPILDWLVKALARESGGVRERGFPGYLKGHKLVKYSTMTQLAMKLFFGLGGTEADLFPEDRPRPKP